MDLVPVSPNDEWVPGQTYAMTYTADAPGFAQDLLAEKVDALLTKFAQDPRVRIESYDFNPDSQILNVTLTAITTASPIVLIVGGLIALAAIYLLTLVLQGVSRVVQSVGQAGKDIIGSTGDLFKQGGLGIQVIAIGAGAILLMLAWRSRA